MRIPAAIISLLALGASAAWAQAEAANRPVRNLAWQPIGARTVDLQLAGPAGGAAVDIAFSADGSRLFAVTARGEVWLTSDLGETWNRAALRPESLLQLTSRNETAGVPKPPQDPAALTYQHPYDSRYTFALGKDLYRSTDQGATWVNLTADGAGSVIGAGQQAITFSPLDPGLIVVANSRGLWRSVDAGFSWSELNQNLPNLPETKILQLDENGVRVFLENVGPAEWDRSGVWRPAWDESVASWQQTRAALPVADQHRASPWPLETPAGWAVSHRIWRRGVAVSPDLTACAALACANPERHYVSSLVWGGESQPNYYAGTSDGHVWVSSDGGRTWHAAMQGFALNGGPVTGIFVDQRDSRVAVAVAGGRGAGHVFRTTNAGIFWDDLSANLPDAPVTAVAANAETGSIYLASEAGVFYARGDLRNPGPATDWTWTRLGGNLPEAPVEDLRLNPVTGSLYVAVTGYGVFRTAVPDVADALRVLNAADLTARAAAPGGLLTVIGAPVRAARTGDLAMPVLASGQGESQIQVPFEVSGKRLDLALETQRGSATVGIPLEDVSPAIFVDAEGAPLVLDAAGGVLLDSSRPAHAGSQILILATGLGRTRPDWPTGLAAPLENPPSTIAPVAAYLNGASLRVLTSTLAGGYIGVYLIRVEIPAIINSGTGELTIASGDRFSNKVRIFLEP